MHVTELDSFVHKFKQLWKAGHTAHLDLDTHAGNVWVGLRVQLGHTHQPSQPVPPPPHRYRGPSYQRRLAKRRAARSQSSPSPVPTAEVRDDQQPNTENMEAVKATLEHKLDDDELTEKATGKESTTENGAVVYNYDTDKHEQKVAERAETTEKFECPICDFKSNWNNGLQVHMHRMHTVLEQIDGSVEQDIAENDTEYNNTVHYWEKGRIGIAYHSFLNANAIIDDSDMTNEEKVEEKNRLLESRKNAFGNNFKNYPPWKK